MTESEPEPECRPCRMYGGSRITMHSMKEDVKKKIPPFRQLKGNFDSQPRPHEMNHSGSPTAQKMCKSSIKINNKDEHTKHAKKYTPADKQSTNVVGQKKPTIILSETQRPIALSGNARGHNIEPGTHQKDGPCIVLILTLELYVTSELLSVV